MKNTAENSSVIYLDEYREEKIEQEMSPHTEETLEDVQEDIINILKENLSDAKSHNEFLEDMLEDTRNFSEKIAEDWHKIVKIME